MNIVHIVPSLHRGGTERQMFNLALAQKAEGHRVCIIVLNHVNQYEEISGQFEVYFINTRIQRSLTHKSIIEIEEYTGALERIQPNIIHSHSYPSDLVAMSYIVDKCTYLSHHHIYLPILANWSWKCIFSKQVLARFIDKWLLIYQYLKSSTTIISVSTAHRDFLLDRLPFFLHQRIKLVYNSIEISSFPLRTPVPPPGKAIRMISVGSLYPLKNHLLQLQIMEAIIQEYPNASLDIYGQGHALRYIVNKIGEMNLGQHVSLKGRTDNIPDLLHQYDVFLHTSLEETFGLAILEGMCAGLPILCNDAGGNRDLVEPGKNGYILTQANPRDYLTHLNLILANYPLMSEASRTKASQFSNKRHYGSIHSIIAPK